MISEIQEINKSKEELSFKLKVTDETKTKIIEIKRNIYINLENNIIQIKIEHENSLLIYKGSFDAEELKNNYYFKEINKLEEMFEKLKLLLQNKEESTFIIETNFVYLILINNENKVIFSINNLENNNQSGINQWIIENISLNKIDNKNQKDYIDKINNEKEDLKGEIKQYKERINEKANNANNILNNKIENALEKIRDIYNIIYKNLDFYFQNNPFCSLSLFDNTVVIYKKNIKYDNGIYTGYLNKNTNKPHGKGIIIYNNKEKYEGNWKNGLKEEIGIYKYQNDEIYLGKFKNNIREGYGKYTYKNGNIYEGKWKDDKKDGYGKFTYKNGDI